MDLDANQVIDILTDRFSKRISMLEKELAFLTAQNQLLRNQLDEVKETKTFNKLPKKEKDDK